MRDDIHIPLWHHEVVAMHEGRLRVLLRPNFSAFDSYAGIYEGEVVIVRHGEYRFQVFDCGEDWLQPWDVSDELAAKNGNMADPTPSQSFLKWWRDSMPGRNAPVWIWHLKPITPG